MGKPKNKSKGRDLADDDSDVDIVQAAEDEAQIETKPATKQSKKDKRRKKKDDDWEDDISNELETLSMEANKGNPDQNGIDDDVPAPVTRKEKKKKKKVAHDSDEEEAGDVDAPATKTQKKKGPVASFQMLMVDSDDNKSESDLEVDGEALIVEKQPTKQEKKKEKKKKGKDKKTVEDEDLDALLAEIDKPKEKTSKKSKKDKKKDAQSEAMDVEENSTSLAVNEAGDDQKEAGVDHIKAGVDQKEAEPTAEVVKVEPKIVTIDDLDDDDEDDKKKKKKKKGKKEEKDEGDEQREGEEDEEGTVKTAAQKRKEKKERERLKKMGKKKKETDGAVEGKTEEKSESEKQDAAEAAPSKEVTAGDEKADEGEDGDEESGKKKKKDKKKKGEKEEKKKKPKAPVAAIKELLKKQKEEEERLQREEDERIRKEEEEYQAKLEAKRVEDEKRMKKKEKERLRKQRLKDEGKLLTEKQKQDKRRAMQLIETMKEQGIEIPQKTDEKKKRPVYYDKKKKKQQQKTEDDQEEIETTPSPTESPATTPLPEVASELEVKVAEEVTVTEEVKVTEDDDGDVKDEWDVSSDEEDEENESSSEVEEKKKVEVTVVKQTETKQAEAATDDDDDDDDEDDDDESDLGEDEDDDAEVSSEESDLEEEIYDDRTPYERAKEKLQKRHIDAENKRSTDVLRAPVVCVLGHVDTGKTKILDKLRRTNVQDGEAGGITQQIGATNVPLHAIKEKTTMCKEFQKKELKLPGLLIIDTPGHESFSNLRSRGSSLCDIAVLVVDIMHGLEPQTIESINLLKDRKTPFVVALNKVDRLYQWKSNPNSDIANTIKRQTVMCKQEFDERSRDAITQLAEQGLNSALFYENKSPKEYISLVPTSAHSGDGMGNLLALICELTQTWLAKKVSYSEELHATVMEVKSLPGLGTTIDVILVNGKLHEGDQIVMAGSDGPIVTQIRGLLMPQPMKELRVKGLYEHHKEVPAAQGVKLIGKDFEKALAGLPLYVAYDDDEVEYYQEELSLALKDVLSAIKLTERGVFVQASTLGSLEALLEFLRTSKIPYAGINIGPVHKREIMKASVMLEHDSQYAVILAFDVKVERDAQEMADSVGVTIFTADIIYHLQDKFMAHREQQKKQKQDEFKNIAVFPCKLRVLPQFIFNSRDPIVVGVSVEAGFVKHGSPICVPSREFCFLGLITSIEINHKQVDVARKGQEVCIKIENIPSETPKLYGRHFEHTDMLVSKISRASIDAVKNHFREEMGKSDWTLLVELKKLFQIL